MLTDDLTPHRIRLHVTVDSWEAALRVTGELLVRAGACTPGYVDAMIAAVRALGPYVVLAPGLALAHARPEDGAREVGASLVTLAPPVDFGAGEKDPVSLIIAFCAVDSEQHLNMLEALARFLENPQRRRALVEAASVDEVIALLERA